MCELTISLDGQDSSLKEALKKIIQAHCSSCKNYNDCSDAQLFAETGLIPPFVETCERVNDTFTAISY